LRLCQCLQYWIVIGRSAKYWISRQASSRGEIVRMPIGSAGAVDSRSRFALTRWAGRDVRIVTRSSTSRLGRIHVFRDAAPCPDHRTTFVDATRRDPPPCGAFGTVMRRRPWLRSVARSPLVWLAAAAALIGASALWIASDLRTDGIGDTQEIALQDRLRII